MNMFSRDDLHGNLLISVRAWAASLIYADKHLCRYVQHVLVNILNKNKANIKQSIAIRDVPEI